MSEVSPKKTCHFTDRACPRCGSVLVSDGKWEWCSKAREPVPCRYGVDEAVPVAPGPNVPASGAHQDELFRNAVLAHARALREIFQGSLTGGVALALYHAIVLAGLDFDGSRGQAYFRYPNPECGKANDCDAKDYDSEFMDPDCHWCGTGLGVENLHISEGWLERL